MQPLTLQSWSPDAWNNLNWLRSCNISQGLFRKKCIYHIKPRGIQGKAWFRYEGTSTIVGPMAFNRLVTLVASNRTLQLKLGAGLALGTGMPNWLKAATLIENGNALGTIAVTPDCVTYTPANQPVPLLTWDLDLPLLKYTGTDRAIGFGPVIHSGNNIAYMLVPRMNSCTAAIECDNSLIKKLDVTKLNADLENGLLGLLALNTFCLDIATQWHLTMRESHPMTTPG